MCRERCEEHWISFVQQYPPSGTQVCFELRPFALIPLVGITIVITPKPAGVSKQMDR